MDNLSSTKNRSKSTSHNAYYVNNDQICCGAACASALKGLVSA